MNSASNSFRNNEYYPYGLPMSSSGDYQGNDYKYGGKEFDMFQKVNIYDFAARTYVPDEARFWQPDPRSGDYHWLSPYAFCAADPVNKIDPTGEIISVIFGNDVYTWQNLNGLWMFYDSQGYPYQIGNDSFIDRLIESLHFTMSGSAGRDLVEYLAFHEKELGFTNLDIPNPPKDENGNPRRCVYSGNLIGINFSQTNKIHTEKDRDANPDTNFAHELAHARYDWMGLEDKKDSDIFSKSEVYATHIENKIRAEHSLPLRTYYESDEIIKFPGKRLIHINSRESRFVDKQERFSKKELKRGNGYVY